MLTFLSLMLGTLVSEDLACITAGLLVQRGAIGPASAIVACTLGIFVGDVGLWGLGRLLGRAAFAWSWIGHSLEVARVRQFRAWLDDHAGHAIVSSRFLPGTRLPLYVVAGFIGLPGRTFAGWALVGTLLWTPALVVLAASLGGAFSSRVSSIVGSTWIADALFVAVMLLLLCARRVTFADSSPIVDAHRA